MFVSVDILSEVVEDGVWDQAIFASNVVDALGVSQVKSFDDVVGQVLVRVLGTKLLLGQHVDGGLSVLAAKYKIIKLAAWKIWASKGLIDEALTVEIWIGP